MPWRAAIVLDRAEHLGQARPRHRDVFDEHVARCGERGVHGPPDVEQPIAGAGVGRHRDAPARGREPLGDRRGLVGGTRTVGLREQERLAGCERREGRACQLVVAEVRGDTREAGRVDEFEHGWAQAGGGDGSGCRGRGLDVGEHARHGDGGPRRDRPQPARSPRR